MVDLIRNWLVNIVVDIVAADALAHVIVAVLVLLLSLVAYFVTRRVLLAALRRAIKHTKNTWDNVFLERKVFDRLSHVAPAIVIKLLAPLVLEGYERSAQLVDSATSVYIVVVALLVVDAFLNALLDIYRTFEISRRVPIKGFIQVLKIVIAFVGGVVVLSIAFQQTPVVLFSGLGAFAAVLMLVFKDPILGFVAGVQLIANKMVARGDWIEIPQYNADGDVLEVTLTTIKVQNWDKTISYVPTQALVAGTFKNWRGMSESGGRRIKRALYLDMSTIKLCDEAMLEKFAKIQYIADYIDKKKAELEAYNAHHDVDPSIRVNGRRMTNVGTFRAYVLCYLKHHPLIHQQMTLMVRQLAPGPQGLPIEIYAFSKDTVWAHYEALQADLFDHLLAVAPEFGLRVFQEPTGNDWRALART